MLRLGILGAATIAPEAIIKPATHLSNVTVQAVAARDRRRAAAFASRWDIPRVADDYRSLVESDDIDAIYVSLPAANHAEWTRWGAQNGKHVLCEKPFTVTAKQAERALNEASSAGVVVMDAYHYHYHPFFAEIRASVPALGQITHITGGYRNTVGDFPVYWDRRLGGGSLLHFGAYPLHCMRTIMGREPVVSSARAAVLGGVDIALEAELDFAGIDGYLCTSMAYPKGFDSWLTITGTAGHLHATNLICPQYSLNPPRWLPESWDWDAQLTVTIGSEVTCHRPKPGPSTYQLQLQAFADAIEGVADEVIDASGVLDQAVAIDAIHEKAGVPRDEAFEPS
jgi:predicted dehydrogenase